MDLATQLYLTQANGHTRQLPPHLYSSECMSEAQIKPQHTSLLEWDDSLIATVAPEVPTLSPAPSNCKRLVAPYF